MKAFIWFSSFDEEKGKPFATMSTTIGQICTRGMPWIDFNCACTLPDIWACFDPALAQIECNHEFEIKTPGVVDPAGEGEVWFTDFGCFD
ncbi:hypothetical protein HQ571_00215 [Candidatus Kuenenbacteria bacterium]|nr:hypothetical protein [Candidatus Kuenenbacteria bacterium]